MLTPLVLLAAAALPQEPDGEPPFLDLYTAGVPALLAHGKDEGLRRFFAPLPASLRRMLGEQDGMRLLGDVLVRVIEGPARARLAENPAAIGEGAFPLRMQLEMHGLPPEEARRMRAELDRLFDTNGGAPERFEIAPDLYQRADGSTRVVYGTRGGAGLFAMGAPWPTGVPAASLPAGTTPLVAARVEPEGALRILMGGISFWFFPRDNVLPNWYQAFFGGLEIEAAYGLGAGAGHAGLHLAQLGRAAEELGVLSGRSLSRADLASVPGDARLTLLWALDPAGVADAASLFASEALEQPGLAQVLDAVAPRAQEWLGDVGGCWLADSTGGLDLTALVVFHELGPDVDPATVLDALEALATEAAPDLRTVRRDSNDGPMLTLQFPGLPVPVEPTLAAMQGRLWFALQPGSILAALAPRDGSLAARPELAGELPPHALGLVFLDTPALAPRGGPLLAMGLAGAANFLRGYGQVGEGPWVPTPPALGEGARPLVATLARDGEDLVGRATCDPSLTVNLAGLLGLLDHQVSAVGLGTVFVARSGSRTSFGLGSARGRRIDELRLMEVTEDAVPEGLEVPAEGGPVATARRKKLEADLATIDTAITAYVLRNGGEYPQGLADLITPDANGHRYLDRTEVPQDPWGNEYLYDPPVGNARHRVYSLGRDGVPGGVGEDEDHGNERSRRAVTVLPPGQTVAVVGSGTTVTGSTPDEEVDPARNVPTPRPVEVDEATLSALAAARRLRARADLRTLDQALVVFALRNGGRGPDSLQVLVTPDANGQRFIDRTEVPRDPWGQRYYYRPASTTRRAEVFSLGADGIPGGRGEDADLSTLGPDGEPWAGDGERTTPGQEIEALDALDRVDRDLDTIGEAIQIYMLRNANQVPDGLEVLVTPDANGNRYIDRTEVPKDPWGNAYRYEKLPTEGSCRIYTLGRDGQPGGSGPNADSSLEMHGR